ncbi:UNVERIFIED_CONTAM: hypothetical protein K2H54_008455 [Gekko kuhli]
MSSHEGPWRDSWFDNGLYSKSSGLPYQMTSEAATKAWVTDRTRERSGCRSPEDEEYGLGQQLVTVEQTQQRMMQEFEKVILAIPDMMIRALRAEREVQQQAPAVLPLQVPQQVPQQEMKLKRLSMKFTQLHGDVSEKRSEGP